MGKDKRKFLRTNIKHALSIIKHEGKYEVVEGSKNFTPILIALGDISVGGVSLFLSSLEHVQEYHDHFKQGAFASNAKN